MRLLLVEDDRMIGRALKQGLSDAGMVVDWVTDVSAAELALLHDVYALVLLDLGLPGPDGMTLLKQLRARQHPISVLIITARDSLNDRLAGLNAGADDYLLKPFDLDELIARIRAVVRRSHHTGTPWLECGALRLDPEQKTVTLHGEPVALSAREFAVLETLMQRPGTVISRAQLEDSLYGWEHEIGSNAIEVHLHHLRRKLGAHVIGNVRGLGYKVLLP